jgi:hypothetical protein
MVFSWKRPSVCCAWNAINRPSGDQSGFAR